MSKTGEFAEIVIQAGTGINDVLAFKRNRYPTASDESWHARYPFSKPFHDEGYEVYQWKDGYAYSRPFYPQLGEFRGRADTAEEAMERCAEDFAMMARLRRWIEYMKNNEPPTPQVTP
jgi:hypothetical protein